MPETVPTDSLRIDGMATEKDGDQTARRVQVVGGDHLHPRAAD